MESETWEESWWYGTRALQLITFFSFSLSRKLKIFSPASQPVKNPFAQCMCGRKASSIKVKCSSNQAKKSFIYEMYNKPLPFSTLYRATATFFYLFKESSWRNFFYSPHSLLFYFLFAFALFFHSRFQIAQNHKLFAHKHKSKAKLRGRNNWGHAQEEEGVLYFH